MSENLHQSRSRASMHVHKNRQYTNPVYVDARIWYHIVVSEKKYVSMQEIQDMIDSFEVHPHIVSDTYGILAI